MKTTAPILGRFRRAARTSTTHEVVPPGSAPALLQVDPEIRAIAMSGYTENSVMLDPVRHGFKPAWAKPFECEQISQTVSLAMAPR